MKQTSRAALETERRELLFVRKWLRWSGYVRVFVGCVLAALVLQQIATLAQIMADMVRVLHIPYLAQWGNLLVMGVLVFLLLCSYAIIRMGFMQKRISMLPLTTG